MDRANPILVNNYSEYAKLEQLRNFEPRTLNQRNHEFVEAIDKTTSYWDKSKLETEPNSVVTNVAHVARVKGFIMTESEYTACQVIIRCMRTYLFRKRLQKVIIRKR